MGMGKSENMANSGRRSPIKGNPVLNPRGVTSSKRDMKTLDARPKSKKHAQGIVHDGAARCHNTVIDTGAQQSMVRIGYWDIIKRHYKWIDAQGINMGGSSKSGHRLQLVGARGVVKHLWMESAT